MYFSTHFDRIGQWQQLYIFVPVSHFANDKQLLLIDSALEDKEEKYQTNQHVVTRDRLRQLNYLEPN